MAATCGAAGPEPADGPRLLPASRDFRAFVLCLAKEVGPARCRRRRSPAGSPGLIASVACIEILVNRFEDHLPYHRQQRTTARHGFPFSRQTTDGWALDVTERWFQPLVDVMLEEALASAAINTDDTPVKVRDAHGKQKYQGRFWTYVGDDLHPFTVLRYTPNRGHRCAAVVGDGPGGPADV